MGKHLNSLRAMACVGMAVSVLGLAGCASSERSDSATDARADKQLALDVADNLRNGPGTTYPDVGVSAHRGQVHLRGFVASETQKTEAERIASRTPGVTKVQNDLSVSPAAPVGGATTP